jgi:hypothetical protein
MLAHQRILTTQLIVTGGKTAGQGHDRDSDSVMAIILLCMFFSIA